MPGPFLPPTYSVQQAPVWDMGAVLSGAASTATAQTADYGTQNFKGVTVVLDMTVVGTGSVTVTIQGKDSASGKYFPLHTSGAITANGTYVLTIYPGITAVAGAANASSAASGILPAVFRILVTANNANATTWTLGAVLTT